MMNMNRNLDFCNHQYAHLRAGFGRKLSLASAQRQGIKFVMESIGYENTDYAIDYHDGGDVKDIFG